ncbi:MAG: 50S ribosomal protein L24 [Bacilli bacterium]|nr:50S ribosomal protein L24 [Bacilli bacterium]
MNLRTGDKAIIIAGKDKGSTGKIIKVLKKKARVIVEGVNLVKKHLKPNANNQNGGIIQKEASIHISNVMLVDSKTGKKTRTRSAADKAPKKETTKVVKAVEKKEPVKAKKVVKEVSVTKAPKATKTTTKIKAKNE